MKCWCFQDRFGNPCFRVRVDHAVLIIYLRHDLVFISVQSLPGMNDIFILGGFCCCSLADHVLCSVT